MYERAFSNEILTNLLYFLDENDLEYEIYPHRNPQDLTTDLYFKEASAMEEAIMFESSNYVKSFADAEQKREAFTRCVEQLKLLMQSEVDEFALMCGYMVLEKV